MMVADLARAAGFDTVHLGANVPVSTLVETARELDGLVLVGISVSTDETLGRARAAIAELAACRPDVRVVLGGPAVRSEAEALDAGATAWAPDAFRAAELFARLADRK
jgi:methanogenic corrinoid protein MtbC1